jgi:hypothetical protein
MTSHDADGLGSVTGVKYFLPFTANLVNVGSSEPPRQFVLEATSSEIKRPSLETDHTPQFNAEAKNDG